MDNLNVVLFGGTFNPVHNGHLAIAQTLLSKSDVDQVWFVLANQAPLKDKSSVSFKHRLAMLELAIEDVERLKVCTIEENLPTPSYTIDTLKALQQQFSHHFSWVIGSDQVQQIEAWKEYELLLEMIPFYVILRDDDTCDDSRFLQIHAISNTSSTSLRSGKSNDTHQDVLRYMIYNHLYNEAIVSSHMSEYRFHHSLSVLNTARKLSKNLSVNGDEIEVACMYHDIAKEWNLEQAEKWLQYEQIDINSLKPYEVHAYAASAYLKHYYFIENENILDAIKHHVSGKSVKLLAKILYVADKIEPSRKYDTKAITSLAMQDIDVAFEQIKNDQELLNQTKGGML